MSGGEPDVTARLRELEGLIREMEDGPESPARARARRLVAAVVELHGTALARLLEVVAAAEVTGPALIDALAREPLVAGVLLLHGLHPLDLQTRARAAIAEAASGLRAHGATLALVGVADGAVRVRLERAPARGGLPPAALRARVEAALVAAVPDAARIEIEGPPDAEPTFVPLERVRLRSAAPEARSS